MRGLEGAEVEDRNWGLAGGLHDLAGCRPEVDERGAQHLMVLEQGLEGQDEPVAVEWPVQTQRHERAISPWLMAPLLFLILMVGPLGLLLYLITREVIARRS